MQSEDHAIDLLPVLKVCGGACCSKNGARERTAEVERVLEPIDGHVSELALKTAVGGVRVELASNCLKCNGAGPEGCAKAALHCNSAGANLHQRDADRVILGVRSPVDLIRQVAESLRG